MGKTNRTKSNPITEVGNRIKVKDKLLLPEMKYISKPLPIYDAKEKVLGKAAYTDDMAFPNVLHGAVLMSPVAHARITSIDTSKAEVMEGVHAVITHHDSPRKIYNRNMRRIHEAAPATEYVFNDTVRYVGDKVAAVAADTEEIARQALRLIEVKYEELPAIFDPEEALVEDAYPIYPEGNLVCDILSECGEVEKAYISSDYKIEHYASTAMIHHGAIEPHICVAYWSDENELHLWEPQRAPFRIQIMLSKIFDVPQSKIFVHGSRIGGTFGSKESVIMQPVALLLSKKSGRYVKVRYNRKECITSTYTRPSIKYYCKIGVQKDGKVNSIDISSYMRVGAYCGDSLTIYRSMMSKYSKLYQVSNMRLKGYPAYTNTPLGGAMRGYGSPNIFFAIETMMDSATRKLGMDPVVFREKNLMDPFDTDPLTGLSLGNGRIKDCLLQGSELFGWKNRRDQKASKDTDVYAYGYGVATTLHGNGIAPNAADLTVVSMELFEDGTVMLRTGITDHGAGSYTALRQIAAEVLDMPLSNIKMAHSDTFSGHYDKGAGSSRNTWVGGAAVQKVASNMLNSMISVAAESMDVHPDAILLKDENFCTKDGKRKMSKSDVAEYACEIQRKRLIESLSYSSPQNAGSYGAHFAEVRVNKNTGEVKVLDYLAACDIGRAINPMLAEGQIEGAILMGLGMALYEGLELDEKGVPLNASFKKYYLPRAKDMPNIQIHLVEEGEEIGPFGAKSIGEASIVPVAPAIVNAINHALDSELYELPISSAKIMHALRK